jgi:hypothetical protein
MNDGLSLPQRLALVRWLTDTLAHLREDDLLPQATAEMPPGARLPVMFGGQHAGWVNMPKPTQRNAYVADEKKLLAWAEANYPDKVETVEEVAVDDDLIAFLAEHYPSALRKSQRVRASWVSDICAALKQPGYYVTLTGEKLTEVPGIELPEAGDPVPRVSLSEDAASIIAAAWRGGDIPVTEFLALPAGGEQ